MPARVGSKSQAALLASLQTNPHLDEDVEEHTALVIDSNDASRTLTVQALRSFGFQNVRHALRMIDGLNLLENMRYNVVICDAGHDAQSGPPRTGMDLLDELRRENMLPYSTVFVMLASQATYSQVVEAAEAALDGYLIKPFSINALGDRLREARQRKRVLGGIFNALERQDFDEATRLCVQRFEAREQYWLYAARIGAELLLRQRRNEQAHELFAAVVEAKAVPWARLGLARAHFAEGDIGKARKEVEELLKGEPEYADAFDVLGRIQMEQGQIQAAKESYNAATALTPDCILRLQHTGTLSFYTGDMARAGSLLQQAWTVGRQSRLFDYLSMLMLAFIQFEVKDTKALKVSLDNLARMSQTHPKSVRLRRFENIAQALLDVASGFTQIGLASTAEICAQTQAPAFDLEAAMNVLSLTTRLLPAGWPQAQYEIVVRQIARRFVVSRSSMQVLCSAAQDREEVKAWMTEISHENNALAERAMERAMAGHPAQAVEMLLTQGEQTRNARLIELAGTLLKRDHEKIGPAKAKSLLDTQGVLSRRFCVPSTHIAGIRRSGRSSGGLVLKVAAAPGGAGAAEAA